MTPRYRFDQDQLLQVLAEAGFEPVGQTHRSLYFPCPRCSKPKIALIRENGYWSCWFCKGRTGPGERSMWGWAHDLVGLYLNLPATAAAELLGADPSPGLVLPLPPPWTQPEEEEDGLPILRWPAHAHPILHQDALRGRAYLEGRGLPGNLMAEYGVRYSREWRRVLFPMMVHGFLTGWQGRTVVPPPEGPVNPRRYLKAKNSDDLPRGKAFMFEARLQGTGHAVITEGPVDALKAHLVGGNVAALGKEVTDRQCDVLVREGVRTAYLALDPDAWQENKRMIRRLRDRNIVTRWVKLPSSINPETGKPWKDLGEMPLQLAARVVLDAPEIGVHDLIVHLDDPRWIRS